MRIKHDVSECNPRALSLDDRARDILGRQYNERILDVNFHRLFVSLQMAELERRLPDIETGMESERELKKAIAEMREYINLLVSIQSELEEKVEALECV